MGKHVLHDPNAASYQEHSIRQEKLQDMMVFAGRALPDNAVNLEQLVEWWIKAAKKQNDSTRDPEQLRERLKFALGAEWPDRVEDRITGERIVLSRPGKGDQVPGIWVPGKGQAVLVVHPGGATAGKSSPAVAKAIQAGRPVLLIDAFQTGSAVAPRDRSHQYFLTFNRSDDAEPRAGHSDGNAVPETIRTLGYIACWNR